MTAQMVRLRCAAQHDLQKYTPGRCITWSQEWSAARAQGRLLLGRRLRQSAPWTPTSICAPGSKTAQCLDLHQPQLACSITRIRCHLCKAQYGYVKALGVVAKLKHQCSWRGLFFPHASWFRVARIRQLCGCKCLESLPRCPLRTGAGEKASEVEDEGLLRMVLLGNDVNSPSTSRASGRYSSMELETELETTASSSKCLM